MIIDKARILVIDDDEIILKMTTRALRLYGTSLVDCANSGDQGLAMWKEAVEPYDVVLLDLSMPDSDGFAVLDALRILDPEATVIIMTAHGSTEYIVRAMKAGAEDFLRKPIDFEYLQIIIEKALRNRWQRRELEKLSSRQNQRAEFRGLVGSSTAMLQLYDLIERLADNDTTVLIQGETGTGKELVARALHELSPRNAHAITAINCGALPESILESELFGHEKGSFSGAVKRKYGLIEQAEGGTLFLDEIEDMSPMLQVELLRAIQEREVLRVGGDRPIKVDFRLVAATNTDLREHMEKEHFRSDLFYRLSVAVIEIPPLRERGADIALLANHFLQHYARKSQRPVRNFTSSAIELLGTYSWPGNVRELENVVEQAVILCNSEEIDTGDLAKYVQGTKNSNNTNWSSLSFREARAQFECDYLQKVLQHTGGHVASAAQLAGIPRQYFYEKMKRYKLSPPRRAE